jgi:thioredoxin reductase (NADPH)
VVQKTGLKIHFGERWKASNARRQLRGATSQGRYQARSVLLAIGRRGTPRKLGVPGEDASKVVYRLVDAEQYRGQAVLVVGGGDSALEAAMALAGQPGTHGDAVLPQRAFSRVKAEEPLPTPLLRKVGIQFETKFGTR